MQNVFMMQGKMGMAEELVFRFQVVQRYYAEAEQAA
jgi:hypothetical protein